MEALDFNPHHYGVSALEIHFAVGSASHADNEEVVTARSDFEHRMLLIHLTSNRGKDATFWMDRSTRFLSLIQTLIVSPGRAFDESPRVWERQQSRTRDSYGGEIGWGGRIRTFTVLINSEVSYQLDHAPAEL